jgi:hypothetical protein
MTKNRSHAIALLASIFAASSPQAQSTSTAGLNAQLVYEQDFLNIETLTAPPVPNMLRGWVGSKLDWRFTFLFPDPNQVTQISGNERDWFSPNASFFAGPRTAGGPTVFGGGVSAFTGDNISLTATGTQQLPDGVFDFLEFDSYSTDSVFNNPCSPNPFCSTASTISGTKFSVSFIGNSQMLTDPTDFRPQFLAPANVQFVSFLVEQTANGSVVGTAGVTLPASAVTISLSQGVLSIIPVPEIPTWLMMGLGLLPLVIRRFRVRGQGSHSFKAGV